MRKLFLATLVATMLGCGLNSCAQKETKNNLDMNKDKAKILVVFFSKTGENYGVGNVTKGNTHCLAEIIAEKVGGELFEIKPVNPYPDSYDECVALAKKELNEQARPALKDDIRVEDYDCIFLGYPNWWGNVPMPVYTFMEKHNWTGKTIIPFCTHEGSGLSQTEKNIKDACKGAEVLSGLEMHGTTAQSSRKEAANRVDKFLKKVGF